VTAARRTLDAAVAEREFQAAITALAAVNGGLSEKAFQQQIVDLARLNAWAVFHPYDSRRSEPGFPDLICVRGAILLAIECKSETGRIRPEQQVWIDKLKRVKIVVADVVRPSDMDGIARVLGARRR